MNDDTISRKQAIDALMSLTIYKSKREIVQAADKDENSWIGGVAECIDEIEDLPSAQPEPCEDAVSRKAVKDGFVEMCSLICPYTEKQRHIMCGSCLLGTAFDVLEAIQPVTPKQHTDLLKAEIKRMKRSFTTCINSDYYTGYMSALSAVEGYIAQWEGEAK